MLVAIYSRVSTRNGTQDTENQAAVLREYATRQGWEIVEYEDQASGKTSDREAFNRLFEDARRKKFDLVLFWALDRFSREGALKTLELLQQLTGYGVAWKSYSEQYLDSLGPFADAIIGLLATLARQERIRISERTKAGLAVARAKGKQLGRRREIFDRERLLELKAAGYSWREIGLELGISKDTARNCWMELATAPEPVTPALPLSPISENITVTDKAEEIAVAETPIERARRLARERAQATA